MILFTRYACIFTRNKSWCTSNHYVFSFDDSSYTQQNSWPSQKENACIDQSAQRQDIVVVFFPFAESFAYRYAAEIHAGGFWKSRSYRRV